jgi:hypothetical protein
MTHRQTGPTTAADAKEEEAKEEGLLSSLRLFADLSGEGSAAHELDPSLAPPSPAPGASRPAVRLMKDAARVRDIEKCLRLLRRNVTACASHDIQIQAKILTTSALAAGNWQACLEAAAVVCDAAEAEAPRNERLVVARKILVFVFERSLVKADWKCSVEALLFGYRRAELAPLVVSPWRVAAALQQCTAAARRAASREHPAEDDLQSPASSFSSVAEMVVAGKELFQLLQQSLVPANADQPERRIRVSSAPHCAMAELLAATGDTRGALTLLTSDLPLFLNSHGSLADPAAAIVLSEAALQCPPADVELQRSLIEGSHRICEQVFTQPIDLMRHKRALTKAALSITDSIVDAIFKCDRPEVLRDWALPTLLRAHALIRGPAMIALLGADAALVSLRSFQKVLRGLTQLAASSEGLRTDESMGLGGGAGAVVLRLAAQETLLFSAAPPREHKIFMLRQKTFHSLFCFAKEAQGHPAVAVDEAAALLSFCQRIYARRDFSRISFASYAALLHHVGKHRSLLSAWHDYSERRHVDYSACRSESEVTEEGESRRPSSGAGSHPLHLQRVIILSACAEGKWELAELLLVALLESVVGLLDHQDPSHDVEGHSLEWWSQLCSNELAAAVRGVSRDDQPGPAIGPPRQKLL